MYVRKADSQPPVRSDDFRVILEGKVGVGLVAWLGPASTDRMIINITGTRKNVRVDLWNTVKFEYGMRSPSNAAKALERLQCFSILACSVGAALRLIMRGSHSGHLAIIRGFVQSVHEGKVPPVSVEQAREVVKVLEAITQMAAIAKAA